METSDILKKNKQNGQHMSIFHALYSTITRIIRKNALLNKVEVMHQIEWKNKFGRTCATLRRGVSERCTDKLFKAERLNFEILLSFLLGAASMMRKEIGEYPKIIVIFCVNYILLLL